MKSTEAMGHRSARSSLVLQYGFACFVLLIGSTLFFSAQTTHHHVQAAAEKTAEESSKIKEKPGDDFFLLCSGGDAEKLKTIFETHPDWVHAVTDNGESCLHLTGIMGQTEVTRLLLQRGADPNIRSTFSEGLRMHPLSWNVYSNHVDNARLLLEAGADVNADFDLKLGKSEIKVVTSLDIVNMIKGDSDDFDQMLTLLRKYGAKTMSELEQEL